MALCPAVPGSAPEALEGFEGEPSGPWIEPASVQRSRAAVLRAW